METCVRVNCKERGGEGKDSRLRGTTNHNGSLVGGQIALGRIGKKACKLMCREPGGSVELEEVRESGRPSH